MKNYIALFCAACYLYATPVMYAQCTNGSCLIEPPVAALPTVEQPVTEVSATGPSTRAAVRVSVGNGCGSGSVCGFHNGGSLILSNAHVTGTRVGTVCSIDAVVDGQAKRLSGRVIMAAYSDRTLADWSIIHVKDWQEVEPVPLSKETPTGSHYTRGSPRCIWPQRSTDVRTVDISDRSPLWRWMPNAIGGQSGSGVWSDQDDKQYGLLTWSWGGYGAGQQTAVIWKQAREKSTSGPERIPGLIELQGRPTDVIVETGFFSQAGIDEFDIWGDGQTKPPAVDPPAACDLTEGEAELIEALRGSDGNEREAIRSVLIGIIEIAK